MKWIGLTGGLGTGKSTVANILREQGFVVLDADRLAAQVIAAGTPGLKSVVKNFGPEFLLSNGELNREKMSQEVFSKPESLAKLESIVHPLVKVAVENEKDAERLKGATLVFYDVPLLYEKNISGFDAVIVVTSRAETQQQRIQKRNLWSADEIKNRLKNQLPLASKIQKADYVIHNDSDLEALKLAVEKVLRALQGQTKS